MIASNSASNNNPAEDLPNASLLHNTSPRKATPARALVVGGNESWFNTLVSTLAQVQPETSWSRTESRLQALNWMATQPFDALVVEASPAGKELLEHAARTWTRTLRIVRCDLRNRTTTAEWNLPGTTVVGAADNPQMLLTAINRAWRLQQWMAHPAIARHLPQLRKLPVVSNLYTEVTAELKSANGSIERVAELIAQDPVMTAKILQVVNSAFFGLTTAMTSPGEAVLYLGSERTRALILLAGIFSQYDKIRCPGFSPESVWNHSLLVANLARGIALAESDDAPTAERAFTAGLLHDVGELILAGNVPDAYDFMLRRRAAGNLSTRAAELEVLGSSHAEIGACLLGVWGLPLDILEAIAWHHCPSESFDSTFSLLTAVHVADILSKEATLAAGASPGERIDAAYLTRLGLADRRNLWRRMCGIPERPEENTEEERLLRRSHSKEN
jgi:putative nucleotidyltransferase with HDIG domain